MSEPRHTAAQRLRQACDFLENYAIHTSPPKPGTLHDSHQLVTQAHALRTLHLYSLFTSSSQQPACDSLADSIYAQIPTALAAQDLYAACLGLASIHAYQPTAVGGRLLALLANSLIQAEEQPGGPYRQSQYAPKIITNAAVSYLMNELGTPLPRVHNYLRQIAHEPVKTGQLDLKTIYYLALAADPADRKTLAQLTLQCAAPSDATEIAYQDAATRLLRITTPTSVVDNAKTPDTPLTAALIAEALISTSAASTRTTPTFAGMHKNAADDKLQQEVFSACQKQCKASIRDAHVQRNLLKQLERIQAVDTTKEISLIAYYTGQLFTKAGTSPSSMQSTGFVQTLGVANILCWLAYTLYDDILDEEADAQQHLPIANIANRIMFDCYTKVLRMMETRHARAARQLVWQSFNNMDAANAWEIANCRPPIRNGQLSTAHLPNYRRNRILALRAYGHITGPLLVLLQKDYTTASPEFRAVRHSLEQYLIARQLNDDIHDWAADLTAGHFNAVSIHMIRKLQLLQSSYSLSSLTAQLKEYFWHRGLLENCDAILRYATDARTTLEHVTSLHEDSVFRLIDRISLSAQQAKQDYQQHRDFATTFREVRTD